MRLNRLLPLVFLLVGCAHTDRVRPTQLNESAPTEFEPWAVEGSPGYRVSLPHYVIYSTIADHQTLVRIGQVMEGALIAYRNLTPQVPPTNRPMESFLFQTRTQWAAYTRAHTGEDAAIYLRVNRGGYTVGDKFVAYWIGDVGTFSVAAHEGWHQYVARHLKGRLPPFLEEGTACLFEQVEWIDGLPRFDVTRNSPRLLSLRAAVDEGEMYPLAKLVRMHAGQVVGQRNSRIESFYAESWAFARFLNEADGGRYQPALHQMLLDASRGQLYADNTVEDAAGPLWDPASARPMLEHYLAMDLDQIEIAFSQFVHHLVDDLE
jgi:hypothetical protein